METMRPVVYGAGALFIASAVAWELSRRHALTERRGEDGDRRSAFVSDDELWRSVTHDVEPTLLDNPDGVIEYHRQLTVTR